ncbi:precorrin-8X methylmutase [Pseudovibrio exalbescens]|uniref:precorrin-8X methylmutase n=1 Tax=Pseudovibrio exalbescens TaxID=197461 RepID=UPI002366F0A1|nr:precorrin-8X methylmutase [Pseudovibrio exalbescens]MDD7909889.1 precorrin-8X methylmutase [Pseudovibrio exalbescens]
MAGSGKRTYVSDPTQIYRDSFKIVRRETQLDHLPESLHKTAIRLVHACGMLEIVKDLEASPDVAQRAAAALVAGAPILTDVEMVAHGVIRRHLPKENKVLCTLSDPRVPELAERICNTRSAAAVELWKDHLEGAVVAIGNAPTALFHLLDLLEEGWPKPAVILGFPVGFVGASESKQALIEQEMGLPFLTLKGRKGGSALAAAAVNGLAAGLREEEDG